MAESPDTVEPSDDGRDRRSFVRHPVELLIRLRVVSEGVDGEAPVAPMMARAGDSLANTEGRSHNISFGGIALRVASNIDLGHTVRLETTALGDALDLVGRVVWRVQLSKGCDLGIEFDGPEENYRARMIEQICQIEAYRRRRVDAGEVGLDVQTAAHDWIAEHGHMFP
jgi:hypothetical protein